LEKVLEYRHWLLTLTICDPACGSGAFLKEAFDFLLREHHFVDEIEAKIQDVPVDHLDLCNEILTNNLFGVDINEESVEITKLALWLRTAKPNRKLNFLDENIKCGNSLISDPKIDPEKAFDWHKEFPHVFKKGGFDVVIGNPPYVRQDKSSFYAALYKWHTDLYLMFFERVLQKQLLRDDGMFGFIVPRFCLVNRESAAFRKFILQEVNLSHLVETSPFKEANTENAILIIRKTASKHDNIKISKTENDKFIFCNEISKSQCLRQPDNEIITTLTKPIIFILDKMENDAVFLGDISISKRGMEIGKNDLECGNIPCLIGADVSRYSINFLNKFIDAKHPEYARLQQTFVESDLYLRRVAATLTATLNPIHMNNSGFDINSDKRYAFTKNIYGIILHKEFQPPFVLAILNSKLGSFYYQHKFSTKKIDLFPEIQTYLFNRIPIKNITQKKQKPLIALANEMSSLHANAQTQQHEFLRRLTDNLTNIKITKILEHFDRLQYKEFLAELLKQKIKIPLRNQNEWEEFFNDSKTKCNNITKQIEEIDRKINELVYELYGLTEDEIKIIER
ncbi:MAG: Eco57I restriction-modification methylase domain-containing protein, partial [Planctomycetaceae bacterium]|jgi:tRNA1(Val) A37 N6-methylase TrmN6|nr:Eco57I restriction-modification methylase domain-containing protein [Planctomycetaceae bacterium]